MVLTNAVPVGAQHSDLFSIDHLEELLDLLVLGSLVVILLCNGGIGLGVDLALV